MKRVNCSKILTFSLIIVLVAAMALLSVGCAGEKASSDISSVGQTEQKATKFDFSSSTGIKLIGGVVPSIKPKNVYDNTFGINLNWWDKTVTFTQKFKLTNKSSAKVVGTISYMGCNDQTCLPPSTQSINIVVPKFTK